MGFGKAEGRGLPVVDEPIDSDEYRESNDDQYDCHCFVLLRLLQAAIQTSARAVPNLSFLQVLDSMSLVVAIHRRTC
jgi:hypothetical protein